MVEAQESSSSSVSTRVQRERERVAKMKQELDNIVKDEFNTEEQVRLIKFRRLGKFEIVFTVEEV